MQHSFLSLLLITMLMMVVVCWKVERVTGQVVFVNNTPTYIFPDRWQSGSWGWVSDCFSFHKKAYVTGFIYTDYQLGKQRVDEVWNSSSIYGTGLSQWGILADSHIFSAAGLSWYFFLNATGAQCSASPSGFLAQNTFAKPSAYVKTFTSDEGRTLYEFESTFPFPLNHLHISFYVDAELQVPVSMFVPALGQEFDGTYVAYFDFQALSPSDPWPDPTIFSAPSYCHPVFTTPPGCQKSSLIS